MKKWIAIVAILIIISGLAIFEPLYISATFEKMITKSTSIMALLEEDEENISTQQNLQACIELDKFWDSKKRSLQLFYNQNILNDFEMKLARLYAAVKANEYPMALTELEQIYRSSFEQKRLVKPHPANIF